MAGFFFISLLLCCPLLMVFNPKLFNKKHSGHTLQLESAECSSIESVQCCPDYVLPGRVAVTDRIICTATNSSPKAPASGLA